MRGAVAELVAHENDVHDNEGAGGLLVGAGCNPLLEKNRLRDNATEGVRVERGAAGRLMRNVIADNGGAGIFCEVWAASLPSETTSRARTKRRWRRCPRWRRRRGAGPSQPVDGAYSMPESPDRQVLSMRCHIVCYPRKALYLSIYLSRPRRARYATCKYSRESLPSSSQNPPARSGPRPADPSPR